MTSEEFNEKYKDYLEEGHYGLEISNPDFIKWLDHKFQIFIEQPGFKYSQIKSKFGMGRFYCEGISQLEVEQVEKVITTLSQR
jgi:hypothetical protein